MYSNLNEDQVEVCKRAIGTYGAKSQIPIAAEEAAEFIQALMKTFRYSGEIPEEVRNHIVEELADLAIVTTEIRLIFGIVDTELNTVIDRKLSRLASWLDSSSDQSRTMEEGFRKW